jgi:hypothetical protein
MRLPEDTHRHVIVGATGSGKTQAALWHLSHRSYHEMPWVIYNYKRDELIDGIPHTHPLGLDEVPAEPGVYVSHPLPDESVEEHMWGVWNKGNTGVYVDEGYMLGNNNPAFRALLTQGRSRKVPLIVLSQRPVWMDRFTFSEGDFYQVFRLQHAKDRRNVEQFVPANLEKRLPKYHSYYYDVGEDQVSVLKPVPDIHVIYETFRRRLERQRRAI